MLKRRVQGWSWGAAAYYTNSILGVKMCITGHNKERHIDHNCEIWSKCWQNMITGWVTDKVKTQECVRMCLFRVFFLKAFRLKLPDFQLHLQLYGYLPSLNPIVWPQPPLHLCEFMFFPSLRRHVCLLSVSCPPPRSLFPFNHSHCLSGSHGPPKKRKPRKGDCGTIHSNRMVFIFLTTVLECFHLCDQTVQKNERKKGVEEKHSSATKELFSRSWEMDTIPSHSVAINNC